MDVAKNKMEAIIRIGGMVLPTLGIAFAAFTVARTEWIIPVAFTAALTVTVHCNKRFALLALEKMERHWLLYLGIVCVLGLVLRFLFWITHPDIIALQNYDSKVFWSEALAMAEGTFPNTKSWGTTVFYSLIIRVFGVRPLVAAGFNVILHLLLSLAIFVFAKRLFHRPVAGLISVVLFFLSPVFVRYTFYFSSENVGFLLLTFALSLLLRWHDEHDWGSSMLIPFMTVANLWTRSEFGLILFALIPLLYCVDIAASGNWFKWRTGLFPLLFFAVVIVGGMFVGRFINERFHDTHTFLCSDDGWWPRLTGCNYATKGLCGTRSEKMNMAARYKQLTGKTIDIQPNTCPSELVPLIRDEIDRRWASLTFRQKILLIAYKQDSVWRTQPYVQWAGFIGLVLGCLLRSMIAVGAIAAFLSVFANARRYIDIPRSLFALAPLIVCLGIACAVAFAEGRPRYGIVFLCLFPVYGTSMWGIPIVTSKGMKS